MKASPIGNTEFYNALSKALHRTGGAVWHPTRNFTLGVTLLPAREPVVEG